MKKFDPIKASFTAEAYLFWIKERQDEIKCLKAEIKIYKKWYKSMLKHTKQLAKRNRLDVYR